MGLIEPYKEKQTNHLEEPQVKNIMLKALSYTLHLISYM